MASRDGILSRLNSLCAAAPFQFGQALWPFDFDNDPTGRIDQLTRITIEGQSVIGGLNFSEERTDLATIWIARKQNSTPSVYRSLVVDVTSLTAAVVRDGATGGGDYAVLDGGGVAFEHENGREFAVARLSLPINYETSL